ncbi:hypothetical protein [Arthrobacter rhizosphaerae]|uniref:hypothetical protein n=1 Tax=Arthrobacter rhizosphaerae TaxID=2855490 RepID=UPI001FF43137|nr:hypothetical protein [Arthrobacter rhizosphaerae]
MNSNPVLRPKVATPGLALTSTGLLSLVGYLAFGTTTSSGNSGVLMLGAFVVLLAAVACGATWLVRVRRRRAWMLAAEEKWRHFHDAKRTQGTTTEITVLSVDALEPTGSWITIRWNRFEHVQAAWIEALPEPIWPGSVLLISPDPDQVKPGAPWPSMYYIHATECLAWAPDQASR